MLRDQAHIDKTHRHRLLDALDRCLGFVDDTPAAPRTIDQHWVWDGTFGHYMDLAQDSVRRIAASGQEPDFEHLVSTGTLDSLAVIEMIAVLETTFHRKLDLNTIRRSDFESLSGIYQRFFVDAPDEPLEA
jgi:acyl carrier protein